MLARAESSEWSGALGATFLQRTKLTNFLLSDLITEKQKMPMDVYVYNNTYIYTAQQLIIIIITNETRTVT
tara:strand:+ start:9144 stop:9356 length:213 start_codon:yes stop_codon:yes gene_type:complete